MHKNGNLTLCEYWYKLRINKGYKRHIGSLYRVMRKLGYYKQININNTSKYIPKKYNTPKLLGIKWQIDVKFVLVICQSEKIPVIKDSIKKLVLMKHHEKDFYFGMMNIHLQIPLTLLKDVLPIMNINLLKFKLIMEQNSLGIKKKYLERSNKIPMAVLGYKTPLQKRHELIFSLTKKNNSILIESFYKNFTSHHLQMYNT